jgi:serine/threonine-protein kinase
MMSLPRFPLDHEKWTDTLEEVGQRYSKASWSGYPPPGSNDPLIGQTLNGTYVVKSVLGEGGMGRVYSAHHTRITNKRFAIKVLRPEFSSNAEMVARFRREAEAAACITHPNVVGVYDVDETPERCSYLVCEYLEGIDLSEHLAGCGRLPIPTAIHIAQQVCGALESAHAAGVMHRDIKPQNIFLLTNNSQLVSSRPTIKILDFGLSRFIDAVGTQLTRAGVIMGTPAYMAPEQAGGGAVDYRTDIYGLGAVLYAAITGSPPYEGETLQDLVLAVLNQEPALPRTLNPDIPANLELVIQRTMAREPGDRYQSMTELEHALEAFVEPDPARAQPPGVAIRPASRLLLEADAREVDTARPRLIGYGIVSLLLLIVGLSSTVPSIELVTGTLRFTRAEIALIILGIVGTLLTPSLLFFRRIRKSVWGNHAKVLDHLRTIQLSLVWSLTAYGVVAVAVRFLDDVLGRFGATFLFGRNPGASFRGWNLVFVTVALVAAALSVLHRRMAKPPIGRLLRWTRASLPAVGILVAGAVVSLGFLWRLQIARAEAAQAISAAAVVVPSNSETEPETHPVAAEPAPESLATPANVHNERAPTDELAQASARGAHGLIPLSERYPKDPYVLKPLLLAFASRSTGLADAMAIAQRLFDIAPEETRDQDLRFLVRKAANTPGETSIMAFSIMLEHMGTAGPDLLYELMISSSRLSKHADELLASSRVREIASPALRVAYDLRKADTCAAKLPLLDRAAELGDIRSVSILSPLTVGSKRGCGKGKRGPCSAPCPAEARRYTEAIMRIMARQPSSR